ncbi:SEC15 family protein [Pelomonas sp. CA6]|uniref:DUF2059 domain-containing protein n=1 Tax=Pelomonas sp. CA6 TaxID=2907999 RepID=UPI001F4C0779|nr:DUF2059 domain-containing protein [Pelomonas sp. CA6]MCH7345188.1 SEC15 family protein [Pelomonas sp. CA6]
MKLAPLFAALLMAASATTALAQTKKELAAKVVQLQQGGIETVARGILQQPVGQLMQRAGLALQQLPADKREAAAKAIDADVRRFLDENDKFLKERANKLAPAVLGPVLEEKFTEDELRQLVAWIESPLNRKFSQVAPEMQKALAEKLLADAGKTMDERFLGLQNNVGKHLGLTPPPSASKPDNGKK